MAALCVTSSTRTVVSSSCRIPKTRAPSPALTPFTTQNTMSLLRSDPVLPNFPRRAPFSSLQGALLLNKVLSGPKTMSGGVCGAEGIGRSIQNHRKDTFATFLLSSAGVVAFLLGFAPAAPPSEAGRVLGTKCSNGGGGGGGSPKPHDSVPAGQLRAEEDVSRLEDDAAKSPFLVSAGAVQGERWTMEDTYSVENSGRFLAVFDGHGGSEVSSILRDKLYISYRKALPKYHWEERDDFDTPNRSLPSISSHVAALRGGLESIEEDVLRQDHLVYQGSTAVAVVLHMGEDGRQTVISANVGDSRAIMSRKGVAIELTRDHKPNDEREKARIRAQGEEVQWDSYGEVYRVRDLSLSRAIGDRFAKPAVSSEAEIKRFPVEEDDDEFIVLASDGLWDVMTSQEVVDFVKQSLLESRPAGVGPGEQSHADEIRYQMARNVANEALERGSADNVCVLVLWLRGRKDRG